MTKEYLGQSDNHSVVVRYIPDPPRAPFERPLDLCYGPDRESEVQHSPTGFSWGYGGSGPAQLAFAILACEFGPHVARDRYQDFKWAVIALLPDGAWTLTSADIRAKIAVLMDTSNN
jgi:hypothetical protein